MINAISGDAERQLTTPTRSMILIAYSFCEFLGNAVVALITICGGIYTFNYSERRKLAHEAKTAIHLQIYQLKAVTENVYFKQFSILEGIHEQSIPALQGLILRAAEGSDCQHKRNILLAWEQYTSHVPRKYHPHEFDPMQRQLRELRVDPTLENTSVEIQIQLLWTLYENIQTPFWP